MESVYQLQPERAGFDWVENTLSYAKALGQDRVGGLSNCRMMGGTETSVNTAISEELGDWEFAHDKNSQ